MAFPPLIGAPPANFAEELGTEFVTIFVGPERKEYAVHKKFLTSQSDYFDKALNGGFKEAEESSIHLKEDDPAAIGLLVGWLYRGIIPSTYRKSIFVKGAFPVSATEIDLPAGGTLVPFICFFEREPQRGLFANADICSYQSISCHPQYSKYSPEELRMADYRDGRKCGPGHPMSTNNGGLFGNQSAQGSGLFVHHPVQAGGFGNIPVTGHGLFGNPPVTGHGLFGSQPATGNSLFGNPPSQGGGLPSGLGAPNNSGSLFGNPPTTGSGLFSGFNTATPSQTNPPQTSAVSSNPPTGAVQGLFQQGFGSQPPAQSTAPPLPPAQSQAPNQVLANPFVQNQQPAVNSTGNSQTLVLNQVTGAATSLPSSTSNQFSFGAPTLTQPQPAPNLTPGPSTPQPGPSRASSPASFNTSSTINQPFSTVSPITGIPAATPINDQDISSESAHQLALLHLTIFAETTCWPTLFNAAIEAYIRGERNLQRSIPIDHIALIYERTHSDSTLRVFAIDCVADLKGDDDYSAYTSLAQEYEGFLEGVMRKLADPKRVAPFDGFGMLKYRIPEQTSKADSSKAKDVFGRKED